MTNDNHTRKKASSVFFAAVMVISMVAAGFAAAPAAAATLSDDYDRNAEQTSGATLFQGQEVAYNVTGVQGSGDLELREVNTGGDNPSVGTLEQALDSGSGDYVIIDTSDLETGQYVITRQSSGDNVNVSGQGDIRLEVVVQDLTTEFDDDTVGDDGDDALVDYEISSNVRNNYAVNVDVDGLDEDDLEQIFSNEYDDEIDLGDDYDRYNVSDHIENTDSSNLTGDYALHEEDGYITLFRAENDEHELNFTGIDAGEYEFNVSGVDSTAEDSDSITVEDVGDGDVEIEESSLTTQQGDTVEFTVTADGAASTGTVVIGNEDDFGYQANVSIDDFGDDDEITLEFNTYTAGIDGVDPVSVVDTDDDDDEITVEGQTDLGDSILASGDYDLSSAASSDFTDTVDSSDDVATLFIEERSTESIQTWTTSDSTASDILDADDDEQLDELTTAVEDGDLTQTTGFAHGDTSVHQISASGLGGALEFAGDAINSDDESEQLAYLINTAANDGDFNTDNAIEFRLRETRSSAGPNAQRTTIDDLNANEFDVLVDEENDDYYVILDTSELENRGLENDEDYAFDVEFTVQDERLLDPDEDIDDADEFEELYNTVSAEISIEERSAEFDLDPVEVTAAEDQTISGTSNVAPGTEFTVRARSDTGTQPSFVKSDDEVTVNADGTWEATLDFSDTAAGDEFTASIQQLNLNDDTEADGLVVEQVSEPANFAVSDLSPSSATATAGDSVDVSATIENTGGQEATQSVALTLDGEELDSQDVTLGAGNSTTVEFTADTSGLDAGDYEHGVSTDDDEATGTLTIEAADDTGSDDGGDDTGSDDGGDDTGSDDGTDDSTPGFGALVALVALIAAALLATRRTE